MFFALLLTLTAHGNPQGEAMEALAAGRGAAASGILRQALVADPDDSELRCLLGRVELISGAPARAQATLQAVPADASCGRRAAWVRAEALLALGQPRAAAAIYGALGDDALGDGRDQRTAERLEHLADRVMARKQPNPEQAARTLTLALQLDLSQAQQLQLARKLADLAERHAVSGGAAIPALERSAATEPADRLRLAQLLGRPGLLDPLPDSPELLRTRLRLSRSLAQRQRWVSALQELAPNAPSTLVARQAQAERLQQAGWTDEARTALSQLATGFDLDAGRAARLLLRLEVAAGRTQAALDVAADLLQRFPSHPARAEVEAQQLRLRLRALREAGAAGETDAALALADALVADAPRHPLAGQAQLEAGFLAARAGRDEQALRRWRQVGARWPGGEPSRQALRARWLHRAIDQDDPSGALVWLEELAKQGEPGASELLEQARRPRLSAHAERVSDPQQAAVQLVVQNIDQLELAVHRIDLEGWQATGGMIAQLEQLDVAITTPDARWSVSLDADSHGRPRQIELPVRVPGPGLYSVTVGTPEQEAQVLLLVSSVTLIAHSFGDTVAVAVLDGDRPASGARVVLRGEDGQLLEGRTDTSGLFTAQLPAASSVLVQARGGSAMLSLDPNSQPQDVAPALVVDLDRAVYRPGDRVGLRIASSGFAAGDWRIWLEEPDGLGHPWVRSVAPDAHHSVVSELVLSARATGPDGVAAAEREVTLWAQPPGAEARAIATLSVADEVAEGRRLTAQTDADGAHFELHEEDGSPVAGVPLRWTWGEGEQQGTVTTDAEGRANVPRPGVSGDWKLWAELPGTGLRSLASPPPPAVQRPVLWSPRTLYRPGEAGTLHVDQASEVEARVQWSPDPQQVKPITAPWPVFEEIVLRGPEPIDPWAAEALRPAWQTVSLQRGTEVRLPTDHPGAYRVLLEIDGAPHSWSYRVDAEATRLLPLTPLGPGQALQLGIEGRPTLAAVNAGGEVMVRFLQPGQRLRVPVAPGWGALARVSGVDTQGAGFAREVPVHNALDVSLSAMDQGDRWRLQAQVQDANGEGVPAQVVLRAVDLLLEEQVGRPASADAGPLRPQDALPEAAAIARGLLHATVATPVSPALLAEAFRQEEARRAQAAAAGDYEDNTVRDVLAAEIPLALGGLGTSGSGSGGGGWGGGGGYGRVGESTVLGVPGGRRRPLQGYRQRVLWRVVEADPEGRVAVDVALPQGHWRLEAVAVDHAIIGRASVTVISRGGSSSMASELSPLLALALTPDPRAARSPDKAAIAARGALAALPAAQDAAQRDALQLQALRMALALDLNPANYRDVTAAAQALTSLHALRSVLGISAQALRSFSEAVPTAKASRHDRLQLALARANAGLGVEDASLSRLLREAPELEVQDANLLARTLIALGREREGRALIQGDGVHAQLARASQNKRWRPGELGAPPPLGDPLRPDWIAAVAAGATPSGWQPKPQMLEVNATITASLRPKTTDGLPLRVADSGFISCGPEPCRLALGDALQLRADPGDLLLPEGLSWWFDPVSHTRLIRLDAPGSYTLRGLKTAQGLGQLELRSSDTDARSPLAPEVQLGQARAAVALGQDGLPLLGERALDDWQPQLRRDVADLRFSAASNPQTTRDSFEDLQDLAPDRSLGLDEVRRVAHAYSDTRPARAIAIWKIGLGAAFADEVRVAERVGALLGPLAAIQLRHDITTQYPEVPEVARSRGAEPIALLTLADQDPLPLEVRRADVTRSDLLLMAASWDRSFIALHPKLPQSSKVGVRLALTLLDLDAPDQARRWAGRLARQHDGDNALRFLEAVAAGSGGDTTFATRRLRQVARRTEISATGARVPSAMANPARLALAQLAEARGARQQAREAYAALDSTDARASLATLERQALDTGETTLIGPNTPAKLQLRVSGLDQITLRAWSLDLRTLFLRDGGLDAVTSVQVPGIRPQWSHTARLRARSIPTDISLRLGLQGEGAWLVQASAGEQTRSTLVVRSALALGVTDSGSLRRVTVLRNGRPAPGVGIRALAAGEVIATQTDLRGVAWVPAFAPVLAFEGDSYAFSELHESRQATTTELPDELLAPLKSASRRVRPAPSDTVLAGGL